MQHFLAYFGKMIDHKFFVSFKELRRHSSGTIRDARCWVLDNVKRGDADIFAYDSTNAMHGGISFRYEKDCVAFLLVWA